MLSKDDEQRTIFLVLNIRETRKSGPGHWGQRRKHTDSATLIRNQNKSGLSKFRATVLQHDRDV